MKKLLTMILALAILMSLAACGSKVNTAAVNGIRFVLPEGYTVTPGNASGIDIDNEHDVYDANGQLVFILAYFEDDWSAFGYADFEQYFKSQSEGLNCEPVEFENAKALKFPAAEQGFEGFDTLMIAYTNKDTTVTGYAAIYNEKDAEAVNAFLNAVK